MCIEVFGDKYYDVADFLPGAFYKYKNEIWEAVVTDKRITCQQGFSVGSPYQDKWLKMDNFGPYPWTYFVWKVRQTRF